MPDPPKLRVNWLRARVRQGDRRRIPHDIEATPRASELLAETIEAERLDPPWVESAAPAGAVGQQRALGSLAGVVPRHQPVQASDPLPDLSKPSDGGRLA
jgi:hypothetical protein